ncbi:hypothetical protein [Sandaracinobacteroides hominis]|uniref:hypothetical protein n=1 Tax=Sandaracinobacteroides hominis TaxID=2780086 RepID=UPI0018F734C8|nr:hypothetical protein [Sandaracinobacteroides hominis]
MRDAPWDRLPAANQLVVAVARRWRAARNSGEIAQPHISALLTGDDCAVLSPVFDSLLTLFEAALGRPVAVGTAIPLSDDESLLLGLLDGSKRRRACIECNEGAANALDCALCSTRIMMALAIPARHTVH